MKITEKPVNPIAAVPVIELMLLDYDKVGLQTVLKEELEFPPFRLHQLRRWIFARKTVDFELMTDLSKSARESLKTRFGPVFQGEIVARTVSGDATEKLLLRWPDGQQIECVLLRDDRNHRTACISTQVGCAMNCAFCASGMDGFVRNLTRGEILEQVLRLNTLLPDNERLTHLVVMGIGEPLLNLSALLSALEDVTDSDGLDLGLRRVTISTVGIPAGIRQLAQYVAQGGKGYKLAISLHAPNDRLRSSIIPQNKVSGIQKIIEATDDYFSQTGRRVTFEYTLIHGVNDHDEHARQLIDLLRHRTAIVNLIPLNPVPGKPFQTPDTKTVTRFVRLLQAGDLKVKVRFRKGDQIDAACGQLRRQMSPDTQK